MLDQYRIFIGFDQKEATAFHTCVQSIVSNSSVPVSIIPLALTTLESLYTESHSDGSNDFIYSRFLVPFLTGYRGSAVFMDGDMVVESDIKMLFEEIEWKKAVQVVQHDYLTKSPSKYLGNKNENYPRKNWSSVILWNCEHPSHRILEPQFISQQTGAFLHRFKWLDDSEIGTLDMRWNWLAEEYSPLEDCHLIHYTLGTPCFEEYRACSQSARWHHYYKLSNEGWDK